jgi:hypothetical protein
MRRLIAVPALVAALALPAQAQSRFHLVAGGTSASFTQASADPVADASLAARRGMVLGVGVRHSLGGDLMLAPELLYAVKGVRNDVGTADLRFGYVMLPMLLRRDFRVIGAVRPHVLAGPSLAYLVGCNFNGGGAVETCDERYGEAESFHEFDVGLMLGAGLEYNHFGVALRYEHGLRDLNRSDEFVAQNRTAFLLATVGF